MGMIKRVAKAGAIGGVMLFVVLPLAFLIIALVISILLGP